MALDSTLPIVILCLEAETARVEGNLDRARELLRQAWEDAATPWERAVAAHYVAGVQPAAAGRHHWHRTAIDEARLADAETPDAARDLWPSLHLAFAASLEDVGSPDRAAESYREALEAARALGLEGEGHVRAAEDGLRRVGAE